MRESAQAALSWVRGHAAQLGLDSDWFAERDVHIHVPAGAVPEGRPLRRDGDGDRARSLVDQDVPVSEDVAMTGEITLTGQVLPIGGVKEKVLAAERAGIGTVILPQRERGRPRRAAEGRSQLMNFVLADTIEDVLEAAFPPAAVESFPAQPSGR